MGQIILPTGGSISVEEFHGTAELSSLVRELKITELTDSYRVAVIGCLGRLGGPAGIAVPDLKKIKEGNNRILKEAATQAIDKIEGDKTNPTIIPSTPAVIIDQTTRPYQSPSVNKGYYQKEKTRVELLPVKTKTLFENCPILTECKFCQKIFESSKKFAAINYALSGDAKHCRFCMKNKYYKPEVKKDLAVLTYRSLIGYVYYGFVTKNQVYVSELREMISDHVMVGYSNPLFNYDPESYKWFVDMEPILSGRIGAGEIASTIACQLSALGVGEIFYRGKPHIIYQKIISDLMSGSSMVTPYPADGGCVIEDRGIPRELLNEFIPSRLVDSNGTGRRKWD